MDCTLADIASYIGATLSGDPNRLIKSCSTLEEADENQLSFIYDRKYLSSLKNTKAGVVIVSKEFLDDCPSQALLVENPYLAYAKAAALITTEKNNKAAIHRSAVIGENCQIPKSCTIQANVVIEDNVSLGEHCIIGPNCVIEHHATIGSDSVLKANVVICYAVEVGKRALIHSGAVIGDDGFGFAQDQGCWVKIPQIGSVTIRDDVEVGSNTTIDRGALGNTIIASGVKIDNQVQIAHNVCIGENSAIAACSGIAGSTSIGKNCTLAGGVGVVGHIELTDGVHITAMTMVTHSIKESGVYSSGTPFQKNSDWLKNAVRFKQLNKLFQKINKNKK